MRCKLVLAEVSFPSTGQGIELGWADFLKIPIVCLHKQGSRVSGSVNCVSNTFETYTDAKEMLYKIESLLEKFA